MGRPKSKRMIVDGGRYLPVPQPGEYFHKYCTWCKLWKPFSQFVRSKESPDGLLYKCKQCHHTALSTPEKKVKLAEYGLRHRLKNLEKERERRRKYMVQYRLDYPEKALESAKRYNESERGKQKIREYTRGLVAKERWMKAKLAELGINIKEK